MNGLGGVWAQSKWQKVMAPEVRSDHRLSTGCDPGNLIPESSPTQTGQEYNQARVLLPTSLPVPQHRRVDNIPRGSRGGAGAQTSGVSGFLVEAETWPCRREGCPGEKEAD